MKMNQLARKRVIPRSRFVELLLIKYETLKFPFPLLKDVTQLPFLTRTTVKIFFNNIFNVPTNRSDEVVIV